MGSLRHASAAGKTFELVAERGPAPDDLNDLFAALDPDAADSIDGVRDTPNMPLAEEPERVRNETRAMQRGE